MWMIIINHYFFFNYLLLFTLSDNLQYKQIFKSFFYSIQYFKHGINIDA